MPPSDVDRLEDLAGVPLAEIPQPPYVTVEDARFAVRAVVTHAPLPGPAAEVCRHDRRAHPCRLHRWGRRVLGRYGLAAAEIDDLIARGDPAPPRSMLRRDAAASPAAPGLLGRVRVGR